MKSENNLWVLGHKITPVKISGEYDMVIGETAPNVPGPPPHYHSNLQELFMVIEGEMEFIINGELKKVKAGETVDLPSNVVHTFQNSASNPCKWVNIHSPKGFLSFFQDMGVPESESNAMQKSVDKSIIDKVMKTSSEYDMHIQL